MNKYKEMICLLTSYEEALFKTWALAADKKTLEGLSRPLLMRDPETQTLAVNFGRDTLAILNEVTPAPGRTNLSSCSSYCPAPPLLTKLLCSGEIPEQRLPGQGGAPNGQADLQAV